jgi:O-antigen ligase
MNMQLYRKRNLLLPVIFLVSLITALYYNHWWVLCIPFVILLLPAIGSLTINKTIILFYVLVALLPLSAEVQVTPTLGLDFPDEPLMALITFLCLAIIVYHPKIVPPSFINHPLISLLALHIFWICITCVYSTNVWLSLKFLLAKTWYIVPFVVLPSMVHINKAGIKKLAICLIVPMVFVIVQSLIRHAFYGFNFEGIKNTLSPFFRNHVTYSSMLVCLLAVVWAMLRLTPKSNIYRLYPQIVIIIFITGLICSYSRGAWLALITGMIAYLLIRKKLIVKAVISFVIILLLSGLWLGSNNHYLKFAPDYNTTVFHPQFTEHLQATVDLKDVSNAERFYRWIAAVNMIMARPVTGFGPNNFYDNYKSYTEAPFKTWVSDNPEHSSVHNYFLLTTLEQGLPGLLFFVLLCVGMLSWSQKLYHSLEDEFYKTIAIVIGVIVIMIGTLNLMNDLIETDKNGSLFWLCLGLLVVLSRKLKDEQANGFGPKQL